MDEEPLKEELKAFIGCAKDGGTPPVPGEEGVAALRLALALIESSERGHVVELGP